MDGPVARWNRFWFEPTGPTNLAVCRIAFYAWLLAASEHRGSAAWADAPKIFWRPTSFFKLLGLGLPPAGVLALLQRIWLASVGASGLGLLTGLSTRVAFLLGLYLLGLPQNFGKVNHSDGILVFVLGIMALSRCGDHYSADRLLARSTDRGDRLPPAGSRSGEYTWPIRAVWLVMSLIFFGAGLSKVKYGGRAWLDWRPMSNLLLRFQYRRFDSDPRRLVLFVARHPLLCRLLAVGTLAIELGYPLALVSPRARALLIPGSIGMLLGFRFLLGPWFKPFVVCSMFWVPWDRIAAWVMRRGGPRPAAATASAGHNAGGRPR